ncbi:MAG: hypothetical protein ACI970_000982, partial [Myxococcota bacterium]
MIEHGTLSIPEAEATVEHTKLEELDAIVAHVADRAKAWVALSIGDRIELLARTRVTTLAAAEGWAV